LGAYKTPTAVKTIKIKTQSSYFNNRNAIIF